MRYLVISIFAVLLACGCRQETDARPPYRDEIDPPSGSSRSGAVWKNVPTNITSAVHATIQAKGYDLRQYWDPQVEQESGKWSFWFQGTMPDPGFSFTVTFDTKTGKTELEPGA